MPKIKEDYKITEESLRQARRDLDTYCDSLHAPKRNPLHYEKIRTFGIGVVILLNIPGFIIYIHQLVHLL